VKLNDGERGRGLGRGLKIALKRLVFFDVEPNCQNAGVFPARKPGMDGQKSLALSPTLSRAQHHRFSKNPSAGEGAAPCQVVPYATYKAFFPLT